MFCQTMVELLFADSEVIVVNQVQDKNGAMSGELSSRKRT